MKIPVDKVIGAIKSGIGFNKDGNSPVRVAVYLDSSASGFLIKCVRDAFVPQTTSGVVRVERIGEDALVPKTDNDLVLVLSCGSKRLQSAVSELLAGGAPVCVVTESSVEAPFIGESTPVLGNVAATEKTYLLQSLAHWILERTQKSTAFASNFTFMRIAAANKVISSCVMTNAATGAFVFLKGADTPVMLAAQVGMLFELSSIFGKSFSPERGYEVAAIIASGYLFRTVTRLLVPFAPHLEFAVKAAVAAAGSFAMGKGLCYLYQRDVDYSKANQVVSDVFGKTKDLVTSAAGAAKARSQASAGSYAAAA